MFSFGFISFPVAPCERSICSLCGSCNFQVRTRFLQDLTRTISELCLNQIRLMNFKTVQGHSCLEMQHSAFNKKQNKESSLPLYKYYLNNLCPTAACTAFLIKKKCVLGIQQIKVRDLILFFSSKCQWEISWESY